MDVSKLLKNVNNLNDYISATQDVITKFSNSKIHFNMSTILVLNKIRSLEIEYFNKCDENGVALKILELMLRTPPSKTWGLLGKELVSLMQYWLDAIRKHLIAHNNHWWNFLSVLLKFMQEISLKNAALNDILVQETAECLLDIASRNQPGVGQRHKIIQCLNKFCAESSREVRFALRNKFEVYFIKLSRIMSSCGDVRTQFAIMETLLRWLLPRQDMAVRKDAALKWFPSNSNVVDIFMKRPWQNFFKDARDFLNALNETSDVVTSVLCRRLSLGRVVLISGTDKKDYWLDFNCGSKCISVMLEPKILDVLECSLSLNDSLVISEDNTRSIQMGGDSELIITVTVVDIQRVCSSNVLEGCDVTIAISTRSDVRRVDRCLRSIFDDKYQLLVDLKDPIQMSPRHKHEASKREDASEDEIRFSHPIEIQRRKHFGHIIRPRIPNSWRSPSTASTSSLAMLREKLTAFPGYRFDKEVVSVCALPQLSSVTEVSETDERSNLNASVTTLKRTYGVWNKNRKPTNQKSQSDNEGVKQKDRTKCISPVTNDDDSISCLLVATIGSADDSVINDTLERLPKHKDIHTDNIVDMLAQEALNVTRNEDDKIDSGFLTSDKILQNNDKSDRENKIVTSSIVKKYSRNKKAKQVSSSTTTDESNTDVIEDTQLVKTKNKDLDKVTAVQQTYDNQAVEDFFSQHFTENRDGDIVISPTLAKKINASSSESSEPFDFCTEMNVETDFNDTEIIDCLNEIIDTVCKDFEKCSEYLNDDVADHNGMNKNGSTEDLLEAVQTQDKNQEKPKGTRKVTKDIKLKFTNTRKQTKTRGRKKNKLDMEVVKRMSPIIERESVFEDTDNKKSPEIPKQSDESDTPLIKRKRKLYSPKDDHLVNERTGVHVSETEEDNSMLPDTKINNNTPKILATSYKDIENLRRKSIRKLRDRKSRSVPSLSPRSKKMNDMFDNLKKPIEGEQKVTLASKKRRNKQYAVYNFTSDSDDEDFKVKTKPISRKTSKSSVESTARGRRTTKVNYTELNSDSTEEHNTKSAKRKNVRQRTKKVERSRIIKPRDEMIDERMREPAQEALDTSVINDQQNEQNEPNEPNPEPILIEPQMEVIADENAPLSKKKRPTRNKTDLSLKKTKAKQNKIVLEVNSDRDNTESPLPGLIIEAMQENKDRDDSISDGMLEKFKELDQEGTLPDISDLNNTQNLLLDTDHNNNSPAKVNIPDELSIDIERQQYNITPVKIKTEKTRKRTTRATKNKIERKKIFHTESDTNKSVANIDIINISDQVEVNSEKTIATVGKSPITGHGDLDESPPSSKQLKDIIQPRGIETQDFNQSIKEYFDKLTNELNEISNNSSNISNNKDMGKTMIVEKSPLTDSTYKKHEKSPSVSIQRLSAKEMNKWLPPRYNSVFGSHQSSNSETSTRKTRSYTKSHKNLDKKSKENTQKVYKSMISPIKLYGELNTKEKSVSSQGDDYVDRIKSLMTIKKEISKPNTSKVKSSKYDLRHQTSSQDRASRVSQSSDGKESSRSVKRKSSPVFEVNKMRKTGDKNSIDSLTAVSGPSGSSVQDWLKRIEREKLISTAESLDLSLRDSLENIIEKLDTTLVEIHHKTSKKFVRMFVDTQKQLNELKEKRHQMFRETAKEVMSEVVKIMNDKFASFDQRSQELDAQFISDLKEKAQNLIHEDCKQKRVMVTLLKEDVQRVMEHIKTGRTDNL